MGQKLPPGSLLPASEHCGLDAAPRSLTGAEVQGEQPRWHSSRMPSLRQFCETALAVGKRHQTLGGGKAKVKGINALKSLLGKD